MCMTRTARRVHVKCTLYSDKNINKIATPSDTWQRDTSFKANPLTLYSDKNINKVATPSDTWQRDTSFKANPLTTV